MIYDIYVVNDINMTTGLYLSDITAKTAREACILSFENKQKSSQITTSQSVGDGSFWITDRIVKLRLFALKHTKQ